MGRIRVVGCASLVYPVRDSLWILGYDTTYITVIIKRGFVVSSSTFEIIFKSSELINILIVVCQVLHMWILSGFKSGIGTISSFGSVLGVCPKGGPWKGSNEISK